MISLLETIPIPILPQNFLRIEKVFNCTAKMRYNFYENSLIFQVFSKMAFETSNFLSYFLHGNRFLVPM